MVLLCTAVCKDNNLFLNFLFFVFCVCLFVLCLFTLLFVYTTTTTFFVCFFLHNNYCLFFFYTTTTFVGWDGLLCKQRPLHLFTQRFLLSCFSFLFVWLCRFSSISNSITISIILLYYLLYNLSLSYILV